MISWSQHQTNVETFAIRLELAWIAVMTMDSVQLKQYTTHVTVLSRYLNIT